MSKKLAIAMFGQKRLSREGGVEIVVKELCTRMAQNGCDVTCYNRAGHHVSGAEYDDAGKTEYEGIRQKSVPTIERRGARDIICGCQVRNKNFCKKISPTRLLIGFYTNLSLVGLIFLFIIRGLNLTTDDIIPAHTNRLN